FRPGTPAPVLHARYAEPGGCCNLDNGVAVECQQQPLPLPAIERAQHAAELGQEHRLAAGRTRILHQHVVIGRADIVRIPGHAADFIDHPLVDAGVDELRLGRAAGGDVVKSGQCVVYGETPDLHVVVLVEADIQAADDALDHGFIFPDAQVKC